DDAAAVGRGVLQVVVRLLDDGLGDGDAGVARRPQRLRLRDRHRPLVLVVAVLGGGVEPAALGGLGVADVLDGPGEDVLGLGRAVRVGLVVVDAGQKVRGEAVAVHVAAGLGRVVGVADEAVAVGALHAALHEPVGAAADVVGVLALADGAALAEQGHAG